VPLSRLLHVIAPPLCAGCGAHAGATEPLCAHCRSQLRWLGLEPVEIGPIQAWAPLAYEGPAQGVVRALKFKGATGAAAAMAGQIAANAPRGWLGPDHGTLVPVPLHPSRARKRGYNQAKLLADAIGERTGMPVADCLARTGAKGTQVGRTRAQRLAGISGGIRLIGQPPPAPVLVDDVITTGATIAACALTADTRAIAYARTPGR
jgi:predicted amidophosphoribosyltransferase